MFSSEVLDLDCVQAIDSIGQSLRLILRRDLNRRGGVVAMSGGIDSSVVAALCVRALGPDRVIGLFLPEFDSSPESLGLGTLLAKQLGIRTETIDIDKKPLIDVDNKIEQWTGI